MGMKRIVVLGCTGSIGSSALEVARGLPGRLRVVGLAAGRWSEAFALLAAEWSEAALAVADPAAPATLPGSSRRIHRGPAGVVDLLHATDCDLVLNGIGGAAGLLPSLAALEAGRDLALANKESVVMAGHLVLGEAARRGRHVIPVDSEHAALASMLAGIAPSAVAELVLTTSGGALRDLPLADLAAATLQQVLAHPTWRMGQRITIDSATLANKGLEVIEAQRLFHVPVERVRVLLHPPSLVHAMVRTVDGTLHMEASTPDMRIPIQNALTWPEVIGSRVPPLELAGRALEFRHVEVARYPMLALAYRAASGPLVLPIAYNAADEVAVAAFAAGEIPFTGIARAVEQVLDRPWAGSASSAGEVLAVDAEARARAREAIAT